MLVTLHGTFCLKKFDISKWDISNVTNMESMFDCSQFNKDISNWKINKDCYTYDIFKDCPIRKEYKPVLPK